jgi:hypothetical protein
VSELTRGRWEEKGKHDEIVGGAELDRRDMYVSRITVVEPSPCDDDDVI